MERNTTPALFSSLLLAVLMLMGLPLFAEEAADGAIAEEHRLKLKDMQGKAMSLHDFVGKGKWLVVMIWQSDCHVCNQEVEGYNAWYMEQKAAGGANMIGITTDGWINKEAAQDFIDRHKVIFSNALVEIEDLQSYYASTIGKSFFGTPAFLIFSPEGKIMAEQTGAVPVDLIDNYIKENSKTAQAEGQPKTSS